MYLQIPQCDLVVAPINLNFHINCSVNINLKQTPCNVILLNRSLILSMRDLLRVCLVFHLFAYRHFFKQYYFTSVLKFLCFCIFC